MSGKSRFTVFFFLLVSLLFSTDRVAAQQTSDDSFEVYLSFRHRGVINYIVTSYYKDDVFYLPVNGLFNTMDFESNVNGLQISGNFGFDQIPYLIDLQNQTIRFGDTVYNITAEDYLIKELDYFLHPDLFSEIFDLNFQVDFNSLALSLTTEQQIPRIETYYRVNQRDRINNLRRPSENFYELKYGKEWRAVSGGFVDYALSIANGLNSNSINLNTNLGLQLFGGDIQGSSNLILSDKFSDFNTNNLRWRYIIRDTPLISKVFVGENNLNGTLGSPYYGIRLTNEPIENQQFFDEFEIEGSAIPDSDVELYLNNSLIDFQKADEFGRYRFLAPIYYGSSLLDLKIFGPTGQVVQESQRIQVPFTFNPQGKLFYNINAGQLKNSLYTIENDKGVFQSDASYGITNWLTSNAGISYFPSSGENNTPNLSAGLSGRLFQSYILNIQAVANGYISTSLNVTYPNSSSFNVNYTDYLNDSGILNQTGSDSQLSFNGFYPFSIGSIPMNFRISNFTRFREGNYFVNHRFNLSTNILGSNIRLGYRDRTFNSISPFEKNLSSTFESSVTYTLPRTSGIPEVLKGLFIRSNFRYRPNPGIAESVDFQVSKSIFSRGRFQLAVGRNLITQSTSLRLALNIELDKMRSTTNFSTNAGSYSAVQNFRGSVGYDPNYNNFIFASRNQVGRSGAAIKMYIDENNNSTFDEEDRLIPEATMRIGRSGSYPIYKNGVLYYTQMQSYFRYNMEVNENSLNNPMLIPDEDEFSIITDPNTFKKIELPFYQAGVVDGMVERQYSTGGTKGIGGLKLSLTSEDGKVDRSVRTFSDGSFYEYPLPPGNYTLKVDQSQLEFLNAVSRPEKIEFTVQATAFGDFVEGLSFTLIPEDMIEQEEAEEQETLTLDDVTEEIRTKPEIRNLEETLRQNVNDALRLLVRAQIEFYNGDLDAALNLTDQSLAIFETAQAYALKGSLYYFKGNRSLAQRNWEMAIRFDPDIYIPDMELLDQLINTNSSD